MNPFDQFSPQVMQELDVALKEIGDLQPVFSEDVQEWVLEHPLYPVVSVSDATPEATIERFKGHLAVYIEHRLAGQTSPDLEARTQGKAGWGGKRPNAGRPSTYGEETAMIRLPKSLVYWLKSDDNLKKVMNMLS
jgi:hypothetical protein